MAVLIIPNKSESKAFLNVLTLNNSIKKKPYAPFTKYGLTRECHCQFS